MGSCYSKKKKIAKAAVRGIANGQIPVKDFRDMYAEKARNAPLLQLHKNKIYLHRIKQDRFEKLSLFDIENPVSLNSANTCDH